MLVIEKNQQFRVYTSRDSFRNSCVCEMERLDHMSSKVLCRANIQAFSGDWDWRSSGSSVAWAVWPCGGSQRAVALAAWPVSPWVSSLVWRVMVQEVSCPRLL